MILLTLLSWLALGPSSLWAQSDSESSTAGVQVVSQPAPAIKDQDTRHMWLLLPQRLVHLQVRITDNGESLTLKRQKYMQQLIARLDTDRDGKLSNAETGKHPLFVQGRRFDGNKFLDSLKSRKPFGSSEVTSAIERAAGKVITYRQNSLASDQEQAVFRVLDGDGSGLIDRSEMRTAAARVAERDQDFDRCITRDEFLDTSPVVTGPVTTTASEPPDSVHSEILRDASEPIVSQQIMRRYDGDHNQALSRLELGWTAEELQRFDTNRSGQLEAIELSKGITTPADLALEVDLGSRQVSLRIVGGQLADQWETKNERLVLAKTTAVTSLPVTLQVVDRDIMAEATQNAQVAFNAIDADANGYLDRDEIVEHQRFERYLFDAMDANDDDRVFVSELQAYVREYTEPATTTCQVTIFNMGFGVFHILDENQDGRISARELRRLEESLLARSGRDQFIQADKLGSAFRIEFQRGGVSLFGRVDRPQAQTNSAPVMSTQAGPIWFQRMDRNGDGDLIWDEFLGPREAFHELDSDGDHLIDAKEATAYENKLTTK